MAARASGRRFPKKQEVEGFVGIKKVKVVTIDSSWQTIQAFLDDPRFLCDLRSTLARLVRAEHVPVDVLDAYAGTGDAKTEPDAGILRAPLVVIFGDFVVCGGRQLDLSRKPKMLALFRAFLATHERFLSSDDLIEVLYGAKACDRRSRRYVRSCADSMVKLLSRARIAANIALGGSQERGLQWFAFDPALKGWHLYRMSDSYLSRWERTTLT